VELCESSRVKTEKPPRRLFLSSRCNWKTIKIGW
jgi:hypothetical protein